MKQIIILMILSTFFFHLFSQDANKKEKKELSENSVFLNIKDEFKLASYFLHPKQIRYYKKLSKKQKRKFLEAFWKDNDPNPITSQNEFLDTLKERIEYCNKHFSYYRKGWKSDRGRIYIKYGEPFEIIKKNTSVYTKYTIKSYEIWKYRLQNYFTYIFLDQQTSGNYQIIFSEGDDKESILPEWRSLLGSDFDITELE